MSTLKSKLKAFFAPKKLTTGQKLNKLFKKHYSKYFAKLNKNHLIQCNKVKGNRYEIPYISFKNPENGNGLTVVNGSSCGGAFVLNPATTIVHTYADSKQILLRLAFSYELCERLASDESEFKRVFDNILPVAVATVENQIYQPVGPVPIGRKAYGTMYMNARSPGRSHIDEFFLEMQSLAGFELRIWADIADLNYETITHKPN